MVFDIFCSMKVKLASPDKIRTWSRGEVKKPETINYRSLKPEPDGLFCEKIFGPRRDWECHCGKYKRIRYKGKICERCGVEVTRSKYRRERLGHIELAAPVSHIWYFKGTPSKMALLLDITPKNLEKVLYFVSYIVVNPKDVGEVFKYQILSEKEYRDLREKYEDDFDAGIGAETIKKLLSELDLDKLSEQLKNELLNSDFLGPKRLKILKRLEVVEAFRKSGNKPEWMILDCIPVIPPDLRPMVQLDGGRFATSDLNDLYRRVINRNNRLYRLLSLGAPDIIVKNEKRMLQEAVDNLVDNGRRGSGVTTANNRPLKSLSDMLKGKQGRFRQNLLGKRVDYSGRSVIVVGPELKIYQCGIPKEMALELFKPFIMKRLVETGKTSNIKSARKAVERASEFVWDALETVIKDRLVLLNRAPTLHRLNIQAFEPILVEGRAIKLHPLVCGAFNADFDGDQMAVHLPLSVESQAESRFLMLSSENLLKPSDGKPITVPTKDMVLGVYYLTLKIEGLKGENKVFKDFHEVLLAYDNDILSLHSIVKVRRKIETSDGNCSFKIIETTPGRIIFNELIPQDLGFVDRTIEENKYDLEIDFVVDKKKMDLIFDRCIKSHGIQKTSKILDDVKDIGFKYSTQGAITVSVKDAVIPDIKREILEGAEREIDVVNNYFKEGLISFEEKRTQAINIWFKATDDLTAKLKDYFSETNPIHMMIDSGARGSMSQIKQLSGMRGLIATPSGKTIDVPIRSNYREGLNVLEYFISSRGARKGSSDTSLRTGDAGYLTRRLIDVSHDVTVTDIDCKTEKGFKVFAITDGVEVIETFRERLIGRYLFKNLENKDGNLLISKDKLIDDEDIKIIENEGIKEVEIRSILTCGMRHGVCQKCYGLNLATGILPAIGEPVGIISAQSIGEPGTQLTMKTFHTGGIASDDITQGLPRVEELFEARKPKKLGILNEKKGRIRFDETRKLRSIIVENDENEEEGVYVVPFGSLILVEEGQKVEPGEVLTEGSINPHDILAIKGTEAVQTYLIKEVQRVYRLHGVDINDKHIEIIVKQMMKKIRIEDPGDTNLVSGSVVDVCDFNDQNVIIEEKNKKGENLSKAVGKFILLGVTKASLSSDSFLSSASFQETTKVLTDSAIKGKTDYLVGLKENIIVGKLIPAGTGLDFYRSLMISKEESYENMLQSMI
ncbi:MAG: DNA-directed RNA polymerase subunit beta' [Candidatus Improbicoccus pseudotrichonymphae]|uniref:DNA-directed RNA polymerase subunit beta' n=1 Tax=Candidatus Improbicoccus pseudotrichonymphae TaxID=3033792 RepID=A0AA48I0V6_9FIRM|nr:MAG: DNA-directed RNA polymerase subunit beta' [Candidatus Improbicoccus pseudotrichonymphae]